MDEGAESSIVTSEPGGRWFERRKIQPDLPGCPENGQVFF
jgi:hypothetical protein